jgi:hypothetical protein
MFKREFLYFQDKLFIVKRIIREDPDINIEVWKEHLFADTVLRKEGKLYFLINVPDLEIIEEPEIVNQ